MNDPRLVLSALTSHELAERLGEEGRPSMTRARRVLRWLWTSSPTVPAELPERLSDVSASALARLREETMMPRVSLAASKEAGDGTTKLLLQAHDGARFETVVLPGRHRTSVCVSSQAGCSRDCRFCATASLGLTRNLDAGEIVAQVLFARGFARRPLRNIVFMGMGEPLDNLDAVLKAVQVLTDRGGAAFSPRHITLSTSGVLPKMRLVAERTSVCIALSLNAVTDEKRRALMPRVARRWPIASLMDFMRSYHDRIFFIEYILIGGENDTHADLERLLEWLEGLSVRINLIPYNPHPFAPYRGPEADRVQVWFERLNAAGFRTMIRRPRGPDIAAACGQLAGGG